MNRQIDDKKYLNYLLQSLNVDDLKQICRDFEIKGYSKLKKSDLVEFILDSLSEEELEDLILQKELEIISDEINLAFKKVNGEDRESISEIKIINPKNHEMEITFKGFNWDVSSYLSITPKNINDPERDCDCRIGSNMGLCSHFWIGFILSLKEGFLKLNDWTLTKLPEDFEDRVKSIKMTTADTGDKQAKGTGKITLVDESSDSVELMKFLNNSVTIYEGKIEEITQRESEFQGNITIFYHITLKDIRLGPRIYRKGDFREEDIVNIEILKIRISEKIQSENKLNVKDKISVNGKLEKDNFWGIIVKNIRKIQKL
ncbi:MAG: Rho termination factor N-terminal domain-containing protein [Candidatus Lokiarchaeota archaeon]|nr:Rho termination factor N-terminal domain-containing protein [Candidatus Lokiarchaeota archaeon]